MEHYFRTHFRKRLRLKDYDYKNQGYYFITICVNTRLCLFGQVISGEMFLNDSGHMIFSVLKSSMLRYPGFQMDIFVVMPNHIHAIIINAGIAPADTVAGPAQRPAPTCSLPEIIRDFKSFTTYRYLQGIRNENWEPFHNRLWQRSYYERVIRNDHELQKIREYIINNPRQWELDRNHPKNSDM